MNQALDHNEIATLSTVLLSNLDESIFFSKLSGFFHQVLGEHKVLIFKTYQDASTQLVADSGKALDNEAIHEKGEGLAAYVARIKRPYFSNNVQRDPLFSGLQMPANIHSELCVPVISEGMILCTINVQSEEKDFSEEDINRVLEVLETLKAPIANMRLYLLAKHLNRQLLQKIEEKDKELSERASMPLSKGSLESIELVGQSKIFTGVLDLISKVASEDYPVLFEGESGVGKKQIARKLHLMSNRRDCACVVVHCSSINDEAMEAEIFGRGEQAGALEQANGGTVVFKDISELSESVQSKLLKALTSGKMKRVGGNESVNLNVRIVTLSRKDMKEEVEEGRFREDLYYRLNTIRVKIPSLSERVEDVKLLASHFLNLGRSEEEQKVLTSQAVEALCAHSWPGNLQELKSVMERTYILSDGTYIEASDLPTFSSIVEEKVEEVVEIFEEVSLFEIEKRHIVKTLEHLGGNKTRAAKSLGITVKTLYNKLHNYGLVASRAQ